MCGTCTSRRLSECLYTDKSNVQLKSDELFSDRPNILLLDKINELEKELTKVRQSDPHELFREHRPGDCDALRDVEEAKKDRSTPNRLLQFRSVQLDNGWSLSQGLTALPATFTVRGNRFHKEYEKIWQKLQEELKESGKLNNHLLVANSVVYEDRENLISAISSELPSLQKMYESLEYFFESPLHTYFQILNKQVIMENFHRFFICTPDTSVRVIWSFEKNTVDYTVGIVLLIFCFTFFKKNVPPSFQKLFTFFCGLNLANAMTLGRAQFLLMMCILKIYRGEGGAGCSDLFPTVTDLCATSMFLGLNNAFISYAPHSEGANIWYWTLFYDLLVSYNMGHPLNIHELQYDNENLPCNSRGHIALLRNFLYIGRKTMRSLYNRAVDPNLEQLIVALTNFAVQNFLPISVYIDLDPKEDVDLFEIMILSPLLAMIVNLYNIRRVLDPQVGMKIKNGFIKYAMISSSLTISTAIRCFELDQEQNRKNRCHESGLILPSLDLSVLVLNYLPVRALMELYGLFFYKITLFDEGLFVSTDKITFNLNLQNLSVPDDILFSFKGVFKTFCCIFDTLRHRVYDDLNKALEKINAFQLIFALEKMNRKIIKMGFERRQVIEELNHIPYLGENNLSQDLSQIMADQTAEEFDEVINQLVELDSADYLDFLNI